MTSKRRRIDGGAEGVGPEPVFTSANVPQDVDPSGGEGTVKPESSETVRINHSMFAYREVKEFDTSFKSAAYERVFPVSNGWKGANIRDARAAQHNVGQGNDQITFMYNNGSRWTKSQFYIRFRVRFLRGDNGNPMPPAGGGAGQFDLHRHNVGIHRSNIGHNM